MIVSSSQYADQAIVIHAFWAGSQTQLGLYKSSQLSPGSLVYNDCEETWALQQIAQIAHFIFQRPAHSVEQSVLE